MRLLLIFLGTIAAVLATLMLLTWWIDPLGQFYDGGPLRAATPGPRPCLISEDLVGSGSWLPFKEDVYRSRQPRTIVVGSSRVLKMGSGEDERDFANLGIPGTGIETLEPLFRRLHAERRGPLTVYIGIELFWFNPSWSSQVAFGSDLLSDVRYLLARQNVSKSLSFVVHEPGSLWRRWQREWIRRWCVLERGSRLQQGTQHAWQADGSFVYRSEVVGKPAPRIFVANPLDVYARYGFYHDWDEFDPARLRRLDAALRVARAYGWRVVGFSPPSTNRYAGLLASTPSTAPRLRQFAALVPPVFSRHGFAFLDLHRAADVPCAETDFYNDLWHAKQPCMETVRRRLDEAAAQLNENVPGA